MAGSAYYNEIDPFAAAWLRNLIQAGHIANGEVDERDIRDVAPDELAGFTQCHFFAGIGVWSYALRRAGWSDDRPVWTGSCPCQPFSAAGKRGGVDDERHLWPAWFHLIEQRRPVSIFGEQVASQDGLAWLDLVQSDLEGANYASGAVDLCAAGVGAPHIRQRLWFMAYSLQSGRQGVEKNACLSGEVDGPSSATIKPSYSCHSPYVMADSTDTGLQRGWAGEAGNGRDAARIEPERLCDADGVEYSDSTGSQPGIKRGQTARYRDSTDAAGGASLMGDTSCSGPPQFIGNRAESEGLTSPSSVGLVEHTSSIGRERGQETASRDHDDGQTPERQKDQHGLGVTSPYRLSGNRPGPTNGFWQDVDWLRCRDERWRPVESGTFPLAHGAANRVGRLRGYGNAINAEAAKEFIEAAQGLMP